MDSQAAPQPVMCEVCGTYFETRRGLSSHARLHLRQLGVTLSENSGAPIELLYQLVRERDGRLPYVQSNSSASASPALKNKPSRPRTPSPREDAESSYRSGTLTLLDHQGSPVRLKESASSLFPSSPSSLRPAEASSSSFSEHQKTTKPLWAPLETDAPITLDTRDDVYVCQLCGCWYGTRKGLSGHARSHLRQMGFPDSEIKGNAIDFLYKIMEDEDLKGITSELKERFRSDSSAKPSSSSKRPSNLLSTLGSPSKRPKPSEDCICVLCGDQFENRKGLASHARSHLRHIGVSDLVGKSSAIDAIEELVKSGMLEPLRILKTTKRTSSSTPSSPLPVSALTASPGQSWPSFSTSLFSSNPLKNFRPLQTPGHKAPKAKKGFRLAVDPLNRKPKPEPVEVEVSLQPSTSSANSDSPVQKSSLSAGSAKPLESEVQSPPTVLCDFCGQLFETRKALSCHARAHLRQLGLSWSIKSSPIDLLKEVMMQGEESKKEPAIGPPSVSQKWTPAGFKRSSDSLPSGMASSSSCSSPLDYSFKDKTLPVKDKEIPCEVCGYDFENRKALASHARAHLRQLGIIEWKIEGASSPIELLSDLIRKDPAKVSQITSRYRMGDLYIRKSHRGVASPSRSTDSESVPGSSMKSYMQQQQHEHRGSRQESSSTASSRPSQGLARSMTAHSSPNVRSPRGVHPPKHGVPTRQGNQDSNSHQPPRSGSIPAMLPKPPLTPLVKLVGKIYSLKCRFCEEVFHGPVSVQERWISHLQKHILSLGYKGNASPPATPVSAPALVHPMAV